MLRSRRSLLGEENFLLKTLPGYRAYCQKVRYRAFRSCFDHVYHESTTSISKKDTHA